MLNKLAMKNMDNLDKLSTLKEAVSSLTKALSTLKTIKDAETNFMFVNFQFPQEGIDFHQATKLYEINLVKQALRKADGHQVKAAKLLNIPTSTLNAIIKRHNIDILKI